MANKYERIREEIAKLLMHRDYEAGEVWCDWDSREPSAERVRESYREDADEILSLKAGSHTLEELIEGLLLTDEEICEAMIRSRHLEVTPEEMIRDGFLGDIHRAIAQDQLDKVLKHKRIRVEAESQEMPEYDEGLDDLSAREAFNMIQQDMLTPKDGCVWVRCLGEEEHES